jgi:hypothetical protein
VNSYDLNRGELYLIAASLFLVLQKELLKWQYPVLAASEKLAALVAVFRARRPQAIS